MSCWMGDHVLLGGQRELGTSRPGASSVNSTLYKLWKAAPSPLPGHSCAFILINQPALSGSSSATHALIPVAFDLHRVGKALNPTDWQQTRLGLRSPAPVSKQVEGRSTMASLGQVQLSRNICRAVVRSIGANSTFAAIAMPETGHCGSRL